MLNSNLWSEGLTVIQIATDRHPHITCTLKSDTQKHHHTMSGMYPKELPES